MKAVKDAAMVTKTQQEERDEKVAAELRHWSERARNAEASNGRLTRVNGALGERIEALEEELLQARAEAPAPEHVQRTLDQFQRREADLVAQNEALTREIGDLRLEFSACLETAKELKEAHRAATAARAPDSPDPWGLTPDAAPQSPPKITYSEQGGLVFSWELDRESREAVQAFEAHLSKRSQEELAEAVRAETARIQAELAQKYVAGSAVGRAALLTTAMTKLSAHERLLHAVARAVLHAEKPTHPGPCLFENDLRDPVIDAFHAAVGHDERASKQPGTVVSVGKEVSGG